jgi:hypothetical protein
MRIGREQWEGKDDSGYEVGDNVSDDEQVSFLKNLSV